MEGIASAIEREVLRWPGMRKEAGRFGATSFRYGKREIGHLHGDRIADLPVTTEMKEDLMAGGRARPHQAGGKGHVSYPLEGEEDGADRKSTRLKSSHPNISDAVFFLKKKKL